MELEPEDVARVLRDSTFFVRREVGVGVGVGVEACRVDMAIEEITRARLCDLMLVLV